MARADSTVRVNVIGDASSLVKATNKAENAVKGFSATTVAKGVIAADVFQKGTDAAFDFAQSALSEFDRLGDATDRLNEQLGDLAPQLIDTADNFTGIGASAQDMLELEARIADIGTAAGISDKHLAALADDAAATAQALTLLGGLEGDQAIDLIGRAATGGVKALRELGISLSDAEVETRAMAMTGKDNADALTEGEKAAAGLEIVLEKLAPRVVDINTGFTDLEQRQAATQAKFETLTGKIGEALEGPLSDLLDFILTGIAGWEMFADQLNDANSKLNAFIRDVQNALAPLARLIDLLSTLATFDAFDFTSGGPVGKRVPRLPAGGGLSSGPSTVNVNVQGGSPEAIEQAVRNAVNTVTRRSGALR